MSDVFDRLVKLGNEHPHLREDISPILRSLSKEAGRGKESMNSVKGEIFIPRSIIRTFRSHGYQPQAFRAHLSRNEVAIDLDEAPRKGRDEKDEELYEDLSRETAVDDIVASPGEEKIILRLWDR